MTLLFFLRSSNGSIPPAPIGFYEDLPLEPYTKKRKEGTLKQLEYDKRIARRQKEEDELLFLLMQEFEDFDA